MQSTSARLRKLLADRVFLHLLSVYGPLTARMVEHAGFEAAYVGGYVSGAASAHDCDQRPQHYRAAAQR